MGSSDRPARALVAVLAGGCGSRLGASKPAALLAGRPLLAYPLAAARSAGLQPVVVAKPDSVLPQIGCPLVLELPEPRHPLCGLVAALEYAADRPIVAVACDMPFVTAPLLAWLDGTPGAVVPEIGGHLQPLIARYEQAHLPLLRDALERQASLRQAVAALAPRLVGARLLSRFSDPTRVTFNVNTPADLQAAEHWLTA